MRPERIATWWIQWKDLDWPNADNMDGIKRRAEGFARADVTAAMLFGAHFRWDYLPVFPLLHDYIAQDLTAISYQISAAREAREAEPSACAVHLDTADRMIRSCKTELRRCLWDLKNEAIGDPSLANAIRTSISPLVQSVKVDIRIDIPRRTLSDNTVHQILSIMRELVSNAITHGRAAEIAIDGRLAGGEIVISVKDDGCGFDPGKCPDETQGHFGLAGIRERAISLDGTFEISSAPGAGTCATIRIKPPPRTAGSENGDAI